jgi:aryl-alcohol dehydrogenase-like predicted oxidoreductase
MPLGIQFKSALSKSLDKSLSRMYLDSADIFWIHTPKNVKKWTKELIPLMKNGKIKYAGVSNHNLEEIKLAQSILSKEGLKLSAVQNHYSLLYRQSEDTGIIDWCKKNQIAFFAYMVMEQGALTGKYNAASPFKNGTRRGRAFTPKVLNQLEGLINLMKKIGEKYQVEAAQIAVAWALSKGVVPIIGVAKPHHVDGAARALNVELTKAEILQLEKAAMATGVEIKGSWEHYMK